MSSAAQGLSSDLFRNMMGGMNEDQEEEKERITPYGDTEDDRALLNEYCEHLLGYWNGKYSTQKGKWDGRSYSIVVARLSQMSKQHVRQAYHEQLQLVLQPIFAPILESLWAGNEKVALIAKVLLAWTRYIDFCDNLSALLKNLDLKRGSEIENGVNIYADPEYDFRITAIALFRNRLLEIEPLLMDACDDLVVRRLNGDVISKQFSFHDQPFRDLVACFISMHDCSSLYMQRKVRWATDRKNAEPIASLRYAVKPTTDEKKLYCASGGLEYTIMQAASVWFISHARSNFANIHEDEAFSRLRLLFSAAHPTTWPKMMNRLDEMLTGQGVASRISSLRPEISAHAEA
jgi:hypothetical protein